MARRPAPDGACAARTPRRGARSYEEFAREQGHTPAVQAEIASATRRVAEIRSSLGEHPAAEASFRRSVALGESLTAVASEAADIRHDLIESYHGLGRLLRFTDRNEEAREMFHRATVHGRFLVGFAPDVPRYRFALAVALADAAGTPKDQPGDRLAQGAIEILGRLWPAVPINLPTGWNSRGFTARSGPASGSEAGSSTPSGPTDRLLIPSSPCTMSSPSRPRRRRQFQNALTDLGRDLSSLGRLAEAESTYRRALEESRKLSEDFRRFPPSVEPVDRPGQPGECLLSSGGLARPARAWKRRGRSWRP